MKADEIEEIGAQVGALVARLGLPIFIDDDDEWEDELLLLKLAVVFLILSMTNRI